MHSSVETTISSIGSSRIEEPRINMGWWAIGIFILITIGGMFGAARIMNYFYPASAFALMLFLYHRYPLLFNSFTWWLYFLSPLVRRIVDYKSIYTNPSPILLAPVMASIVILPSFIKILPRVILQDTFPFAISAAAVAYGCTMGYLNNVPTNTLILGTLGWSSPILYGFFIYTNWRHYPEYRKNIEKTMTFGILVMGGYGIFQYLTLPDWDRLWLMNSEMNSIGKPFPREFRVWSTMNSGEPFAAVMASGLILVLGGGGILTASSSVLGYVTFLLTLVRSGWLGWAGGMVFLLSTAKPQFKRKLLIMAGLVAAIVLPLLAAYSFEEVIGTRLSTFSDLENDSSASGRASSYADLDDALGNFLGGGIRDLRVDSSIFSLLGELGLVGGIPYSFGLLMLIIVSWKNLRYCLDDSSKIMMAATIASIIRIPVNSTLTGISGQLLWGCLAFTLAGSKYSRCHAMKKSSSSIIDRHQ
jgi:hypothetical protein